MADEAQTPGQHPLRQLGHRCAEQRAGQAELAVRLAAAARAIRAALGVAREFSPYWAAHVEERVGPARASLDPLIVEAAGAAGNAMCLDQAVALALDDELDAARSPTPEVPRQRGAPPK